MPGPSSSTRISISFLRRRRDTRTGVVRRREGPRIVDQVVEDLAEATVVADHQTSRRSAAASSTVSAIDRARRRAGARWRRTPPPASSFGMSTGSASARASSASRREASEMSLIRRSRRRTSCWMIDISRCRESSLLGERQRFDRAAQRGQRVLQFVRHVGGETLDRVDPVVERARHVAQRAGKVADLVGPAGEIGDFLARLRCPAAPVRPPRRAAAPARRWRPRETATARS